MASYIRFSAIARYKKLNVALQVCKSRALRRDKIVADKYLASMTTRQYFFPPDCFKHRNKMFCLKKFFKNLA